MQLQFSEVLVKWRRFFSFLAAKQGMEGMEVLEQKLDLEKLQVLTWPNIAMGFVWLRCRIMLLNTLALNYQWSCRFVVCLL